MVKQGLQRGCVSKLISYFSTQFVFGNQIYILPTFGSQPILSLPSFFFFYVCVRVCFCVCLRIRVCDRGDYTRGTY